MNQANPSLAVSSVPAGTDGTGAPAFSRPGGDERAQPLRLIPTRCDGTTPPLAHVSDEQMRMILDMSRILSVPADLDTMLCRIAELCTGLLECERASIFLFDSVANQLWTKVALQSREIRVPCHTGIVGHAFTHNQVVHVPDPYKDNRFNPEPDRISGFITRNLLTAPLIGLDGKPLGAIQGVNKRTGPFIDNDLALIQLLSEQSGVAIQRHKLQLEAMEVITLKHEMDLARRTQQALIPKTPPGVAGIASAGWTLPASTTGGDCFDLWKLPDGRLGILLADASGHGLAPALIVSQARTLIRAISEMESDPHALLTRVNSRMAQDLECGQFITMFLGFLSADGLLHWTSAGHGPVYYRPRVGKPLDVLEAPVQPIGVLPEWMDGAPAPVQLEETGSLLLTTDGIFESANLAGEQLGVERMCQVLDAHQQEAPQSLLSALQTAAAQWRGDAEPLDDQTIVIVQREVIMPRVAPDCGK